MFGDLQRAVRPAIAIFARAPTPGKAKTRLIPLLGPRGAAQLQHALISDAVDKVKGIRRRAASYLYVSDGQAAIEARYRGVRAVPQRGRDLGERLERAFRQLLKDHGSAVIIGTDSPGLSRTTLLQALRELSVCDVVLGPCPDGGYYLVGLRRVERGILRGVRWGTVSAFRDTLRNFLSRGLSCSVLELLGDVDRPQDLRRLKVEMIAQPRLRRLAPATWRFLRQHC